MFYELQEVVERLKREVRPVRQQTPSPSDAIKIQEQIWRSYIMRLAFIDKLEVNWRFVRLGYSSTLPIIECTTMGLLIILLLFL